LNLLGFDTSTAATTACLLRADGEVFEELPKLADVLGRAGLSFADVDALAVGVGPGTFTGLRIGIATARALAAATSAELRPVSSLAALAAGIDGDPVLPLLDAKRNELFAALYVRGEERWPPFAAAPAELASRVREAGLRPLAAGDGSVRFRGVLEAAGIRVEPDGSRAHLVRALHVCRLAHSATPVASEAPTILAPSCCRIRAAQEPTFP
jgi:tRNA threonylcarbamoyladenosine biosynthesis protein TsaB